MGFGGFIVITLFMAVLVGGAVFCFWALNTKSGQRLDRKQQLKNQIRQGMRDEEIEDGILEEAIREVAEEQLKKRKR